MQKRFYFLFIFLVIIFYSFSTDYKRDSNFLYELFCPADEGSNNQDKLEEYITQYLKSISVNYNVYKIEIDPDNYTNSKIIEVFFKSSSETKDTIVILTSFNTPIINNRYVDNSISIEIMLNLIEYYSKIDLKKNILFAFVGSIGKDDWTKYGLIKFLDNLENPSNSIVTVIDILTTNSLIYFTGSMNKKPLPSELIKVFDKANRDKVISFDTYEIKKAKFSILGERNYSDFFNKKGILSVEFSNRSNYYSSFYYNKEHIPKYINFFINWINSLNELNFNFQREYNYLYENIFGYKIFIGEKQLIIIFLLLIFLTLVTRFFFPNFERLRFINLLKILPYFLFLFVLYFVLSFIPIIFLLPVEFFYNIEKPYLNIPLLYFVIVFFLSFLIIMIFIDLFKKLPLTKHSYIYIVGSVLFSNINLILLAFFDISFAYIFIIAVIFITLSNFTGRNYVLKFIFYFLSSIPFIKFIFDITYNINIIKNISDYFYIYNLVFCIASFPFLLLAIRAFLIVKGHFRFSFSKRKVLISAIILLLVSTIVFSIISVSFSPQVQNVSAKIVMNYKKKEYYIELVSDYSLGAISYEIKKEVERINTKKREIKIKTKEVEKLYNITYKIYNFFDYERYEFIIESNENIEFIDTYVYVPALAYIFNTNYPFYSFDSLDYFKKDSIFQIKIPRNPGKKVVLIFDVFKDIKPSLIFNIKYLGFPNDIKIYKDNSIFKQEREFIEEIIIN